MGNMLIENIDKLHTTKMGEDRILRNLKLENCDVVVYCKNKILFEDAQIYKKWKNRYCEVVNIKITINSYSYTIITAHMIK